MLCFGIAWLQVFVITPYNWRDSPSRAVDGFQGSDASIRLDPPGQTALMSFRFERDSGENNARVDALPDAGRVSSGGLPKKAPLRKEQVEVLIDLLGDIALAGEILDRGIDFKVTEAVLDKLKSIVKRGPLGAKPATIKLIESYKYNKDPFVGLSVSREYVEYGQNVDLHAIATDADTDKSEFQYLWDPANLIEGDGPDAQLITSRVPKTKGTFEITVTVIVRDRRGGSDTASEVVHVVNPFFVSIALQERTLLRGDDMGLKASIAGETVGSIRYAWEASGRGRIEGDGAEPTLKTDHVEMSNKYTPIEIKVTVTDDRNISAFQSRTVLVQASAVFRVFCSVPDVQVLVDGKSKGTVSSDGYRQFYVAPGEHRLTGEKDGFVTWQRSYSVAANDIKDVIMQLESNDKSIDLNRPALEGTTRQSLEPKSESSSTAIYAKPTSKRTVKPIYPQLAISKKITGKVTVEVEVDQAGNVTAAKPIEGPELLRQAAKEAASKWKFNPARLDGKTIKSKTVIFFDFLLNP